MKRTEVVAGLLLLLTLCCCMKDTPVGQIYSPYLTGTRIDEGVILRWIKPVPPGFDHSPTLDPDYFLILISDSDPSEFEHRSTADSDIFELTIDNLTNGTPYYFAIKAVKHNAHSTISNTILIIPDNPENTQPLFQENDKEKIFGTWSPDQNSVSYVSDYTWDSGNYGAPSVFISILSTSEEWLLEKRSWSPEWSPVYQKIAYTKKPFISVYNCQDSGIKRLAIGWSPTWSPDGNWIAFISDMAEGKEYNLWKIPSDSGTAIQLTYDFNDLPDLAMISDRSLERPNWSKDGNSIAFSRLKKVNHRYVSDIYCVPSTGGNKTPVVFSQWNDLLPAYSPDGISIAFISDRSGSNQIWTMNLQTQKLKQITGSNVRWVSEWGKIEWSSTGDKILFSSWSENNILTLFTVDIK